MVFRLAELQFLHLHDGENTVYFTALLGINKNLCKLSTWYLVTQQIYVCLSFFLASHGNCCLLCSFSIVCLPLTLKE